MKIAELLQSLADAYVDSVLAGGLAVQLHGFLRATVDIDRVLAMNDANLERFIGVAKQFGLQPVIPIPSTPSRARNRLSNGIAKKACCGSHCANPRSVVALSMYSCDLKYLSANCCPAQ